MGSRKEAVSEVCRHCWVFSYNCKGIVLTYESICSQTKETSTFSKVKHVKKYILWLYANKIQQEKNDLLTLEVGNPLLRLCKRQKTENESWSVRKALEGRLPHCRNDDHSENGAWWKIVTVKAGCGILRSASETLLCSELSFITGTGSVLNHQRQKTCGGEVHEKLGAHCRRSHPVESRMHLILPKVTPDTAAEVPARECTLASEHRTFIGSWSVRNTFKV